MKYTYDEIFLMARNNRYLADLLDQYQSETGKDPLKKLIKMEDQKLIHGSETGGFYIMKYPHRSN